MLLQLPSLSQVPGPDSVIQASSPQLGPIVRDVNATGPIGVALELPAEEEKRKKKHRVRQAHTQQEESDHQLKEHMNVSILTRREELLKERKVYLQ